MRGLQPRMLRYTLTYSEGTPVFHDFLLASSDIPSHIVRERQIGQPLFSTDIPSHIVREQKERSRNVPLLRYTLTYSEGTLLNLFAELQHVIYPHI